MLWQYSNVRKLWVREEDKQEHSRKNTQLNTAQQTQTTQSYMLHLSLIMRPGQKTKWAYSKAPEPT